MLPGRFEVTLGDRQPAEVAENVLHNVGNVLNSINVGLDVVREIHDASPPDGGPAALFVIVLFAGLLMHPDSPLRGSKKGGDDDDSASTRTDPTADPNRVEPATAEPATTEPARVLEPTFPKWNVFFCNFSLY